MKPFSPVNRDKALAELRELQDCGDLETAHELADYTLCGLLQELGYHDVVEEWKKVPKWYA